MEMLKVMLATATAELPTALAVTGVVLGIPLFLYVRYLNKRRNAKKEEKGEVPEW